MDARDFSSERDARTRAADWHARLRARDCSDAERAEFEDWRAASLEHDAAYREVERLWHRSAELCFDPAIRAATQAAVRNPRTKWFPAAIAAALLIAIGVALLFQLSTPPSATQHFATRVGEQQTLALADDSKVLLDADSAITVVYTHDERRIWLERGRAEFTVAPNRNRPFVVDAANGSVRALGTRFQIALASRSVTVILLEGAVSVDALARSATLARGEELIFEPGGTLWSKRAADLEAARGWIDGTLIFKSRPLAGLIEEMNRYATKTRMRIADPSLNTVTVSGRFRADDQQTFLLALEQGWSVHAERVSDDEIVLSRRPSR